MPFSTVGSRTETVVEAVRVAAAATPGKLAFTFLENGETESARYDFAGLDAAARRVAARLQADGLAGGRVLLAINPGPDYVAAFFGCLYAGATAVPCYPPRQHGKSRELAAIAVDSGAGAVLTAGGMAATVAERFAETVEDSHFPVLDVDTVDDALTGSWTPPEIDGDDLAFLQYTSGSTGAPKGVMVRHRDIVRHVGYMHRRFELTPDSTAVSWLPPFHDMGLIAGILMPAVMGYHAVLMTPRDFVTRPARWLEAISQYRGEWVAAPNFAYDLCVERVTDEELSALDLSSWRQACNGAEPVRAETIERFTERFGQRGFRPGTFRPCYGLAEVTLAATIPLSGSRPVIIDRTWDSDEQGKRLVGCGVPLDDHELVIVDPETSERREDGTLGEIWVSGPSIPAGYWNREEETERTFRATLPGGDAHYLRTGDMGLVQDGELYVAGRYKDLIIIRGRNYAPSDIEHLVGPCHPRNRASGTAAFSVTEGTENAVERLVVVQEVRTRRESDFEAIIEAIRKRVLEELEITVDVVVLTKPTALPKTTSGKIQRRACRARFLAGSLEALHVWRAATGERAAGPVELEDGWSGTAEAMEILLAENVGRVIGADVAAIDRAQPFSTQGLDSVRGAEFTGNLSVLLGVPVPAAALYEYPSIRDLARHLVEQRAVGEGTGDGR
ncbi:AMP-binding protein [Amycolatopsis sp. YIM 10]|uniref:AMP-binding protein n=1 Tax=Amycolatopsis sp. YIM 10 TaxID=2653857 RepID=UPI0012904C4F|nr:AMP-binding protein [Amycolatopsis sp. YIM 10]QFU93022.1 Putative fatty-acid--CoA ligase fadD21 [Amycolatopsis sp. YIM 10]